jgi:hypothetical protein
MWLWFKNPHDEFAASTMRTFEPPHWNILQFGKAVRISAHIGGADLKFAAHPAVGQNSECQIQNTTSFNFC